MKLSLERKLILSLLLCGLVPLALGSLYTYFEMKKTLENESVNRLNAIKKIKGDAVTRYFETIRNQIQTFSHSVMVEEAMLGFKTAFKNFPIENNLSQSDILFQKRVLRKFYEDQFNSKFKNENGVWADLDLLMDPLKDHQVALQYQYISSNPNPLGAKEALDYAIDKTTYSKLHKKFHPTIRGC